MGRTICISSIQAEEQQRCVSFLWHQAQAFLLKPRALQIYFNIWYP